MESKLDVTCNLRHCKLCGYCIPSIIKFCNDHDFDWKSFKRGVKASELEKFNLTEFNNVVSVARIEEGRKNGI